jgi:Domain of Unknown Function with PDB structure (DUF3857)/Transglutaminase-like superfamily
MPQPGSSQKSLIRHASVTRSKTCLSHIGGNRWPLGLMFVLFTLSIPAQAAKRIKVDWQPISAGDLALKDNPAAPGEDAMILYREFVIDDWDISNTEYVRIKIFTARGRKWGDVQIPYIPVAWDIKELRARAIRPDGTIVEFNGQMFDETVFKYRGFKSMMRKFSFPDVQPGTIVEYICRRQYGTLLWPGDEWEIQSELYTRLGVFVLRPSLEAGLGWREHGLPPGIAPQKQPDGSYRLEIHDFRGVKQEAFMPPEKVTAARVSFYNRFAPFPANESAPEYWNLLAKLWDKDVEKFVDKRDFLEKITAQTVSSADPPETKLRKLYERAQQIQNLDYQSDDSTKKPRDLKPNESVEDAIKHGYGTSRQINYVFIGLARAAGFQASSLAFTPRDEDFFSPNLQDSRQLTADLVYLRLGSEDRYLDPGNPYFPYGLLPWYASETRGVRLEPGGGAIMVTTPPSSSDATLFRHAELQLDSDGSVSGKLQINFTGQTACVIRQVDSNKSEDARAKDVSDRIKDWLPANSTFEIVSVTGASANAAPLHIEGILRIPEYASVASNRILLPVTPFRASQVQSFESLTRVNPVYFPYPYQELDEISLTLPVGYRVEAAPRGEQTPKSLVAFDLAAHLDGDTLRVNRHLVIDAYSFPVTAYPSLRAFFQTVASADEQQIVLTSAPASVQ